MIEAAAIYARISLDRAGDRLGVARQLEDCRAEAARRGWPVAGEYVDDDISAWSGKTRPAYRRLLADITAGAVDAVVVYHLDRLHRQTLELEEFVRTCDRAAVRQVVTVQGDVNLGSSDGLLIARIMAAVASNESATKARRVRRKIQQNAQAGKPHGGGARAFGFEPDRMTVRTDEAAIIRQLADRLLAGESLGSLTRWLNDEGIPTVTGADAWRGSTVRQLLRSARISGQVETHGEIIGPGNWPAIIDPATTDRIRALVDDPERRHTRTPRRYLLSGLLRCDRCGDTLKTHPQRHRRRYVCKAGPDSPGCGGLTVTAPPVEDLLTRAVLLRLDTPELQAALTGAIADNADALALADQIAADQAQLDELAGLYADRQITAREWTTARNPIERRMTAAKGRLARLRNTDVLEGLIGTGRRLQSDWADLNLGRQRAIVEAVLDHAVVAPATVRGGIFDPDRVRPVWRL